MKLSGLFVAAFCAAALGMSLDDLVEHERRADGSVMVKRAVPAGDAQVPVRIALKQSNLDKGMDLLMEVADPDSPKYSQYHSAKQVIDTFAPSQNSIDAVKRWLVKSGVNEDGITMPASKGFVDFTATVDQLESLLHTKYHVYENSQTTKRFMGADNYHLPRDVADHVDFVYPAVAVNPVKSESSITDKLRINGRKFTRLPKAMTAAPTGCDSIMSPACIKALYDVPDGKLSDASNKLGIFEINDEYYSQSDLDTFYQQYASDIPAGWGPHDNLINWPSGQTPDSSNAVGEAGLDYDVAIPIIYPQGTENYQVHLQDGFLNQFFDAIDSSYCGGDDPKIDGTTPNEACGTIKSANVISFSWGAGENDFPLAYNVRQCNEMMKLGLQGVSLVVASGDAGVAGVQGGKCSGSDKAIFYPIWPSACPYVTSVGGTYLPPGRKVGDPESATASFAAGGGFANDFAAPDYQKDALATFFSKHDPGFATYSTTNGTVPSSGTGGIYNRAGRGYPDVAAVGDNGAVVLNGYAGTNGGTSMSAPIFAAILTRINEERIAIGKKPVGFANPAFYKNPSMFHDITEGGMTVSRGKCKGKSFNTTPGWDPVTGLGTPNYPAMVKYFNSLP